MSLQVQYFDSLNISEAECVSPPQESLDEVCSATI